MPDTREDPQGPLLRVDGLRKVYRRRSGAFGHEPFHAVDGVSFDLHRGETLSIVGESGAGKSTVGLLVLRLLEPDAGTVEFEGQNIAALGRRELRHWRRHAQMVFQNPFGSFDPRASIGQSFAEPMILHRKDLGRHDRTAAAEALVESVGLDKTVLRRHPHEFSGGQLQRLAIARALACEPAMIVADEPVAALDMSIRAQIINLLQDLQRARGISTIFVSHDLSLVRVISDRIAVMYQGRIVEIGTAEAVYERSSHPYTRALISAVPVPNPVIQRARAAIELPIAATVTTGGCAFTARCPYVMEICHRVAPPLEPRADGTLVACHLPSLPDAETHAASPRASDATVR